MDCERPETLFLNRASNHESISSVNATIALFPRTPDRRTGKDAGQALSGANLLTITAGHTLDVVEAVLGTIIEVDARTEILWSTVKLTDTGKESLRETADHVDVLGKTRSGAVFTANVKGALAPEDAGFSFEIQGSEGWLRLTGSLPRPFHESSS